MKKLIISMNVLYRFANRNKWFIHELEWSDCSCSRVVKSLIQMIRLERVFFSELNSQVKNREILWACAKSKLLLLLYILGLIIVTENHI